MTTKQHHFSHSSLPHQHSTHGARVPDLSGIVHSQVVEILVSDETVPAAAGKGTAERPVRDTRSAVPSPPAAGGGAEGSEATHPVQIRDAAERYAVTAVRSAAPRSSPVAALRGREGSESEIAGAAACPNTMRPSSGPQSNSRELGFPKGRILPLVSLGRWRAGSTRAKLPLIWRSWAPCPTEPRKTGYQVRRRHPLMWPLTSLPRSCAAIGGDEFRGPTSTAECPQGRPATEKAPAQEPSESEGSGRMQDRCESIRPPFTGGAG